MLPIHLIASLGYYIAEFKASQGRGNGAAGAVVPTCSPPFLFTLSRSSRRTRHPGTLLLVWRGRERDSGEHRGAHLVGCNGAAAVSPGSGVFPLLSLRAVRSSSNGPDYIPLRGYVTGPRWTMGAVHDRSVSRSTRTMVDRANPSPPRGPLSASETAEQFCTLTPLFQVN
jgi:hypothetical protein